MKKVLKVLAGAAALAAVIPFKCKADDNGGQVKGLFYSVDWKLDPDYQSEPEVNINIGFNNPFEENKNESHLFADELVVDYCCDDSLKHSPVCGETQMYTEEDFADEDEPAYEESGACGSDCHCEGDCECSSDRADEE